MGSARILDYRMDQRLRLDCLDNLRWSSSISAHIWSHIFVPPRLYFEAMAGVAYLRPLDTHRLPHQRLSE